MLEYTEYHTTFVKFVCIEGLFMKPQTILFNQKPKIFLKIKKKGITLHQWK